MSRAAGWMRIAKLTYDRLRAACQKEAGENGVYHFLAGTYSSSSLSVPSKEAAADSPPSNVNLDNHSAAASSSSDAESPQVEAASSGNQFSGDDDLARPPKASVKDIVENLASSNDDSLGRTTIATGLVKASGSNASDVNAELQAMKVKKASSQ